MTDSKNPVVEVAKEAQQPSDDGVVTLSTGIRARLHPVSAALMSDVTARVKDPEVPTWFNEKKGRDERNPNDPAYRDALQQAQQKRGNVAMDAMAMFGVELVDGLPENNGWVTKLRLLGITFDFNDPVECEFYYKKHIALGNEDWAKVGQLSGISQEDIARAEQSFRGDEGEDTD
jgi:hypothetical protein